jgi:hypothetical protein
MGCARALTWLLPSAALVRIRSRYTSARPPSTASIKRPVLVPVSARGFGQESELRLGVHDLFDDGEQVEGVAGEAVNACHIVTTSSGRRASRFSRSAIIHRQAGGLCDRLCGLLA